MHREEQSSSRDLSAGQTDAKHASRSITLRDRDQQVARSGRASMSKCKTSPAESICYVPVSKGQLDLEFLLNFTITLVIIGLLSSNLLSLASKTGDYRDAIYETVKKEEFVRLADSIASSGNIKKIYADPLNQGSRIRNGTVFSEYGEKLLVGQSIYSLGGFDGEPV